MKYNDHIVSDYFVAEQNGMYEVYANFIVQTFEAHPEATVRLKANGRVVMTKLVEGQCFMDTDDNIWTQFVVCTSLMFDAGEEVWVELAIGNDDYNDIRESSIEGVLVPRDEKIELTDTGLSGGGTLALEPKEEYEILCQFAEPNPWVSFYWEGEETFAVNTQTGAVRINRDNADLDEQAIAFWQTLSTTFPQMFPTPTDDLDLEVVRTPINVPSHPLRITKPKKVRDDEAYERAMEMFKNG